MKHRGEGEVETEQALEETASAAIKDLNDRANEEPVPVSQPQPVYLATCSLRQHRRTLKSRNLQRNIVFLK